MSNVIHILHTTNDAGQSCVLGVYATEDMADSMAETLQVADFPHDMFVTESSVIDWRAE